MVVAAGVLAVVLVALPAAAQTADETPSTTSTSESTTTTATEITLLPTTSTIVRSTTTTVARTTTTVRRTTTTTVPAGPVVTVPRTTTTLELREPTGPVPLPTTTSLPPSKGGVDDGVSAGTLVLLVITALLLIALVLGVFTYRFWRSTRPSAPAAVGGTVPRHG